MKVLNDLIRADKTLIHFQKGLNDLCASRDCCLRTISGQEEKQRHLEIMLTTIKQDFSPEIQKIADSISCPQIREIFSEATKKAVQEIYAKYSDLSIRFQLSAISDLILTAKTSLATLNSQIKDVEKSLKCAQVDQRLCLEAASNLEKRLSNSIPESETDKTDETEKAFVGFNP